MRPYIGTVTNLLYALIILSGAVFIYEAAGNSEKTIGDPKATANDVYNNEVPLDDSYNDDNDDDEDDDDDDDFMIKSSKSNSYNTKGMKYERPKYDITDFYFVDIFDDKKESQKLWIISQAKKDGISSEIAKYDGLWGWENPERIIWKEDIGLLLKSPARHSAIAAPLLKPFTFRENKPLVLQYEVNLQEGQECGGSYIKLLSKSETTEDLSQFNDKTPYTIMFGPDKCGNDYKMHFIFRHVNPINGSITEKHCRKPKDRLEEPFKDRLPHLYRLVVWPNNKFEIRVDHKVINSGSLLKDFTPNVNPPREIEDPNDKKPLDWDEREKIPDENAVKPDNWNEEEPAQIPDPGAVMPDGWLEDEPMYIPDMSVEKPEDWDVSTDGEWEPPLIDNPVCKKVAGCGKWNPPLIRNENYKGQWRPPLIKNPNYRGKWAPRKIPNPDFFEDLTPFKMTPVSAIGFELWSISNGILFDNIIITDNVKIADKFAAQTFDIKRKIIDQEADSFLTKAAAYAKRNIWVYVVAVIFLGCTIALIWLLRDKKQRVPDDPKKTDAPQPDDLNAENENRENANQTIDDIIRDDSRGDGPDDKFLNALEKDNISNITTSDILKQDEDSLSNEPNLPMRQRRLSKGVAE